MKDKLLIIDDDQVFCKMLTDYFQDEYGAVGFSDPSAAVQYLQTHTIDVVLTDLNMPGLDGMEVLRVVKSGAPSTDVIIMTGYAQVENAVEAMKKGAYDYIIKPISIDDLSLQLKNLFDKKRLFDENVSLRKFIDVRYSPENVIGESKAAREVRRFIEKVSQTDFPVLITGESGSGKELAARSIHFSGKRKERKFFLVHCSEFRQELLERELFGYEADAIPDTKGEKKGLFEEVGGGTLVLDEIDETALSLQARLLTVIERRAYTKAGTADEIPFNGMLIATANKDLREKLLENKFREDLFYRLNMLSLKIPSLRERKEDIPALAKYFFSLYKKEFSRDAMELSKEAISVLGRYSWPGNVNELKGLFAKLCLLVEADTINPGHVLAKLDFPALPEQVSASLTETEKNLILAALEKTRWNVIKAAKDLGISYDTLRYRMKKYAIER